MKLISDHPLIFKRKSLELLSFFLVKKETKKIAAYAALQTTLLFKKSGRKQDALSLLQPLLPCFLPLMPALIF